jgi:collagenase-like PrtC family protease
MKLAIQLNDIQYLYDYINMGVELFVVGGKYSAGNILNLSIEKIKEIKEKCQTKLVYILVNGLYDQHEIKDLEQYLNDLNHIVDGILFQDFGVLQIVKENQYSFDMMYSPDTLNTNAKTLEVLSKYGVTSAFISRVIPMQEQLMIKQECSIPLMIQGHGVEYLAASKRELLKNYKETTHKQFSNEVIMKPRDSDFECYVYEDSRGTHMYSKSRLYTLDLLNSLKVFDYLYIETLFMNREEAIEVISIYSDCIKALSHNRYDKEVKEYLPLLRKLNPSLSRGFLYDQSVYKLEDMRKIDNERNQ